MKRAAQDCRPNRKPKTFRAFLRDQEDRDDIVGDLAQDVLSDPQFPRTSCIPNPNLLRTLVLYLRHVNACKGAHDALHFATVFVINDEGTWLLKRPQDHPPSEIAELADKSRRGEWVDLYEQNRVKISDERIDIPRAVVGLIAGISLVDALAIAGQGDFALASAAVVGFLLARIFQRYVPAT